MKTKHSILAGLLLSAVTYGAACAGDALAQSNRAQAGVIRCGGNFFLRVNGTEQHESFYILRNFNSSTPVSIDRLTFFDSHGNVLFDSQTSGFPQFDSGNLGPANNVLNGNSTDQIGTSSLFPPLDAQHRPIQAEIAWSAAHRVIPLHASQSRNVRTRNAATGQILDERARASDACTTISLDGGRD